MKIYSYKNSFNLKGKRAVVTGALGILGRRFCEGLADCGAAVALVDLDEKACQKRAADLRRQFKIKAIGVPCDVSDPSSVQSMVKTVVSSFKRIDILHNNAATKADLNTFFAPMDQYTLEGWRSIMAVNLDGMFLVAQAVGRQMIRQGRGGSIVQMGSIYGVVAPDPRIYKGSFYLGRRINTPPVYAVSKAGVIGLTKYLAACWAEKGIRVNSITPGGVESGQNEEFKKRYSARVPMGRMARDREIVGALIYLASDASSYVTGQNIIVDGGLTVW